MNQSKLNQSLTGKTGLNTSIQSVNQAMLQGALSNGGSQVYLPQKYKKQGNKGNSINGSKKGVR
jgi:hypothetical protein